MGAAFNSQVAWIEADVFELIELDKAHEPVLIRQLQNVTALFINQQSVLQNQLGISQIVSNAWVISHNLLELVALSLKDVIRFIGCLSWESRYKLRTLITLCHVNALIYFLLERLRLLSQILDMQIHIKLRNKVGLRKPDIDGVHLVFLVNSDADGLGFSSFGHIVEYLLFDIGISSERYFAVVRQIYIIWI